MNKFYFFTILFSVIQASDYPIHYEIHTIVSWVGQNFGGGLTNSMSAWDPNWQIDFGGVDDPLNRNGSNPAEFIPKMNPFYFALPYNDLDSMGNRKQSAFQLVPWAHSLNYPDGTSMLKGRYIAIMCENKTAYGQWEDAGPYLTTDAGYVFGQGRPENPNQNNAGLAVSPAIADYIGFLDGGNGTASCDWKFVESYEVPLFFGGSANGAPYQISFTSSSPNIYGNLPLGAIVGIAVGSFFVALGLIVIIALIVKRNLTGKYKFEG